MKKNIELMVSPFFGGDVVVDEVTGMEFKKDERFPTIYNVPEGTDVTGIKKLVQKNILFAVSGLELDAQKEKKTVKLENVVSKEKVEAKPEPVKEEVKEIEAIVEEQKEEDLSEKTLRELKDIAKERGIKHGTKVTKAELLKKLN